MVLALNNLVAAGEVFNWFTAFIFGFAAQPPTLMNQIMFLSYCLLTLTAINITKNRMNFWNAILFDGVTASTIFIGLILSAMPICLALAARIFLLSGPTPTPISFFLIATATLFLTMPAPFEWK